MRWATQAPTKCNDPAAILRANTGGQTYHVMDARRKGQSENTGLFSMVTLKPNFTWLLIASVIMWMVLSVFANQKKC